MSSIWKDLLFLHGHLLHKDDLEWRAATEAEDKTAEAEATEAAGARERKAAALACCAVVWPRIVAPH